MIGPIRGTECPQLPDGTITVLDIPQSTAIDFAWSHGLVWAISLQRDDGTLLAIDGYTGDIQHEIPLVDPMRVLMG